MRTYTKSRGYLRSAVFLAFVLCVPLAAAYAADNQRAANSSEEVGIEVRWTNDVVKIERDAGTIVDVRSRGGIGRATLARKRMSWPVVIKIRLHLKGLESFRASAGKQSIGLFVTSTKPTVHVHSFSDEREGPRLTKGNPLWVDVKLVADKKEIPLADGYFELTLPPALFQDNPSELSLHWIDFYRG